MIATFGGLGESIGNSHGVVVNAGLVKCPKMLR